MVSKSLHSMVSKSLGRTFFRLVRCTSQRGSIGCLPVCMLFGTSNRSSPSVAPSVPCLFPCLLACQNWCSCGGPLNVAPSGACLFACLLACQICHLHRWLHRSLACLLARLRVKIQLVRRSRQSEIRGSCGGVGTPILTNVSHFWVHDAKSAIHSSNVEAFKLVRRSWHPDFEERSALWGP